jgi:uncharacterized protein (DUF849 family)
MMNDAVFITCAVTGSGDSAGKSPHLPVTPAQIAAAAIEAHRADAAIVHLHVRDPHAGKASRSTALFRELHERVREQSSEVIINLTGGMAGDLLFGPEDRPPARPARPSLLPPEGRKELSRQRWEDRGA